MTDQLSTTDEIDLSGDSAVEAVTTAFTIENVTFNDVDTDNGTGKQVILEFTSENYPFPITVRLFVDYESKNGKSTDWVKRQRGILKNITKAATGGTSFSPAALIGKQVQATTKDNGEGFPTLGRFKKVA